MMTDQIEKEIFCPYCGEAITVFIDGSIEYQEYIEDCQVCCRPIVLKVSVDLDDVNIQVFHENE